MPEPHKLEKKLPYAEIYGEVANNARYEQNGRQFDAQGREVRPLDEVERELDLDAKARAVADEKRIEAEVQKRLKAMKEA
jgi:hypothetical protein